MIIKISIIIPFKENFKCLNDTLGNLMAGDALPNEVIIIDTSSGEIDVQFQSIVNSYNLVRVIKANGAYPGQARNIGIDSSVGDLLGFLDTRTVPSKKWLSSSLKILYTNSNISGVYGNTAYHTSNIKSNLIKYSTYGVTPLITVPGMLIKRIAVIKIGNFIPSTRAGEDADWMMRLHLQKIIMSKPEYTLTYYGLDEIGFGNLFFKWIRNYKHSSNLPYLNAHKSIYYHGFILLILIVSFNWNRLIAGWDIESDLYVPHITKVSIFLIFFMYAVIRGFILPLKKGVKVNSLIPVGWFFVTLISIVLDFAKLCGFLAGSIARK